MILGIAGNDVMKGDDQASMRRIYGSTLIVGGATMVAILIGVIRSKLFALWLGPAGIGLIGFLNSIVTFAATLVALGLARSGAHEIASHGDNPGPVVRSVMLLTVPLALAGMVAVWLLSEPISRLVADSPAYARAVAVAAIGVAAMVVSGSQLAVLQGLRKVDRIAMVRVGGAFIGSLMAVAAVYYLGFAGLALAVVAIPLGDLLVARLFLRKLFAGPRPAWSTMRRHWRAMLAFGIVTMLTGMATSSAGLAVRAVVIEDLGLAGAGLYQAAWSISVMNISLVLTALAADYFPRLTQEAADGRGTNKLVNQQFHATVAMASPLLLGIAAASPLVLHLLYSSAFQDASMLLRLHTVGDIFRLIGWTTGFVLLARKDMRFYVAGELAFAIVYVAVSAVLVSRIGLEGAGVAYCLAYAAHALTMVWRTSRRHGVELSKGNLAWVVALAAAQFVLLCIAWSGLPTLLPGLALALTFGIAGVVGMARSTGWHRSMPGAYRAR